MEAIKEHDKLIIRELAKRYMEYVTSEKQQMMIRRMRDINDLKVRRPAVLMDEIPWYQMNMDGELDCVCEGDRARGVEGWFRVNLFRIKHFRCDNLFEPVWKVRISYTSTGNGLSGNEKIVRTDDYNNIVAHEYHDVLEDESALEKFHLPEFTLHPERDEENMSFYTELLGDSMPVRLCGHDYIYFPPWDQISTLRGVEPILFDMYDRPEYLHRIMEKIVAAETAELDFIEANMPVDNTGSNLHCTPAYISGLGSPDQGLKATWFRTMAQMFSTVSPDMHEEFDLSYTAPMSERFAYTYYGCCEPLDNKIPILKKNFKNLRKLGVSPWADVNSCAEQIGGDYVYSRKPNPANVAVKTDPDIIRAEIEDTVKACIRYGCPAEFVLKDISTVSNRPENLIVWAETASSVIDEYYGED